MCSVFVNAKYVVFLYLEQKDNVQLTKGGTADRPTLTTDLLLYVAVGSALCYQMYKYVSLNLQLCYITQNYANGATKLYQFYAKYKQVYFISLH